MVCSVFALFLHCPHVDDEAEKDKRESDEQQAIREGETVEVEHHQQRHTETHEGEPDIPACPACPHHQGYAGQKTNNDQRQIVNQKFNHSKCVDAAKLLKKMEEAAS